VVSIMNSCNREINYKQMSLIGSNLNYKKGLQCTPVYSSRSYKMINDGRRKIIVPSEVREKYLEKGLPLPMDRLYESEPFETAEESTLYRGLMKI